MIINERYIIIKQLAQTFDILQSPFDVSYQRIYIDFYLRSILRCAVPSRLSSNRVFKRPKTIFPKNESKHYKRRHIKKKNTKEFSYTRKTSLARIGSAAANNAFILIHINK